MPAPSHLVVAVDGPSGSGKSSVCREVARRLGLRYLDTGAMYRALTWWVLDKGTALDDAETVARMARELPLEIGTSPTARCSPSGVPTSPPRSASRASRVP